MIHRLGSRATLWWRLRQREVLDAVASTLPLGCVDEVVAPSLCALRTFASTRAARHVLVEDLPGLRGLHEDLDAAAHALPDCNFLRNFRAPAHCMVRQEQEYVLASEIRVRSRWAQKRVRRSGVDPSRIALVKTPRAARGPVLVGDRRSPHVLLAGTSASRFGLEVALEALKALPELTLWCRRGDGSSERGRTSPRVRWSEESLPPLRAVIAPSWVESAPIEMEQAAQSDIPVIGTVRALGWLEPSERVVEITPGDIPALAQALRQIEQ
jgi:hypothetical protein